MKGGLLVEDDVKFSPADIIAKMTADLDQGMMNIEAMGKMIGKFYKSLRRNGVPRKLAMNIVFDFASTTIDTGALSSLLENIDDDSDS